MGCKIVGWRKGVFFFLKFTKLLNLIHIFSIEFSTRLIFKHEYIQGRP